MEKFLKPAYYFSIAPGAFEFSTLTAAAVLLLVCIALAVRFFRRRTKNEILKKMLRRYPGRLIAFAFILSALLLFREVNIPFLSMRILGVVWILWFIYWVLKSAWNFRKEYRHRLTAAGHSGSKNKYLPRKKR